MSGGKVSYTTAKIKALEEALATEKGEREADKREMDRLEGEIADLKSSIKRLGEENGLWKKAYEGLEARLELARGKAPKPDSLLSPLLMGTLGGIAASYIGGLGKRVKDAP